MLHGGARPRVGAEAQAHGVDLQRLLTQAHQHRRGAGACGVGVVADGDALEEARLLQPVLVVEQQAVGQRRAGFEVGEVAHGGGVMHHQAFDLDAAGLKEWPAVGHEEEAHAAGGSVDLGRGAAPAGARIASAAQAGQRGGLGLAPGSVAKAATGLERKEPAQLVEQGAGACVTGVALRLQRAFNFKGHTRDQRAWPGVDHQLHLAWLAGLAQGVVAQRHRGREIAFGLQELFDLRRCGLGQARPLVVGHGVTTGEHAQAREVEVALKHGLQHRWRVDGDAQRGWARGGGRRLVASGRLTPWQHGAAHQPLQR